MGECASHGLATEAHKWPSEADGPLCPRAKIPLRRILNAKHPRHRRRTERSITASVALTTAERGPYHSPVGPWQCSRRRDPVWVFTEKHKQRAFPESGLLFPRPIYKLYKKPDFVSFGSIERTRANGHSIWPGCLVDKCCSAPRSTFKVCEQKDALSSCFSFFNPAPLPAFP